MGVLFFEVGVGGVLCGGWVDGIFGGVGWHVFLFLFFMVLEKGKSGVRLEVWEAVFEVEILVYMLVLGLCSRSRSYKRTWRASEG